MTEPKASVGVMWDDEDPITPLTLSIQTIGTHRVTIGMSVDQAEKLASVIIQEVIEHTPELH
jgi:hypothetical protein